MLRRNLDVDRQFDVLAHRVPHGAVRLARQRDRAVHRVPRHVSLDHELQRHPNDAMRIISGAIGYEMRVQGAQWLAAAREDVGDVRCHAAGEGKRERLDWRRSGDAGAVERDGGVAARAGELQLADPLQIDDGRRLR